MAKQKQPKQPAQDAEFAVASTPAPPAGPQVGLDTPQAPKAATPPVKPAAPAKTAQEQFPNDLAKCFVILRERRAKGVNVKALELHIHRLQNGPPPPVIGANEYHKAGHARSVQTTRLELAARSNPDVKTLLAENAQLKAQVEKVTQG